ncbi:hypothetical protein AgCh_005615 [Apium graveolens]
MLGKQGWKLFSARYFADAAAKQYLVQWKEAQGRSTSSCILQEMELKLGLSHKWELSRYQSTQQHLRSRTSEMGMVARDSTGKDPAQEQVKWVWLPELDEALTIKEALSWIKMNAWEKVVLKSDCLVAI